MRVTHEFYVEPLWHVETPDGVIAVHMLLYQDSVVTVGSAHYCATYWMALIADGIIMMGGGAA